jgi:hypothetical protein
VSNPILSALENEWHDITSHLHHHPYHDNQPQAVSPAPAKGNAVSVIDDIKTELVNVQNKASEVYQHAKTVLEQHLPGIESAVTTIENEPFIKGYLGAQLAVPEHLVGLALDFLGKLVQANVAVTTAEPAAEAPAPADPAQASAA